MGARCLQIILATVLVLTGHAVKGEQLPEPVRSVLNLREIPADSLSVHVADVETGEIIVDWMATEPRNPASTLKLMTTLAALDGKPMFMPSGRSKRDGSMAICSSAAPVTPFS